MAPIDGVWMAGRWGEIFHVRELDVLREAGTGRERHFE
jgi:hypothetical protein